MARRSRVTSSRDNTAKAETLGRWPTNVLLDESQAAELDRIGPHTKDGVAVQRNGGGQTLFGGIAGGQNTAGARADQGFGGEGGPSRFFPTFKYQAKAPAKERPSYVADGVKSDTYGTRKRCRKCGLQQVNSTPTSMCQCAEPDWSADATQANKVSHPTVKPLAVIEWLITLVTPQNPDAIVLDPFAGSGTTVEACIRLGVRCIASEREPTYLPLIHQRIKRATERTPGL